MSLPWIIRLLPPTSPMVEKVYSQLLDMSFWEYGVVFCAAKSSGLPSGRPELWSYCLVLLAIAGVIGGT